MADVDSSNEHSKRPQNSKFKQQKLPAWKPILTPKTVLPNVAIIGVIFIAVGIALLVGSNDVKEQEWDYTDCHSKQEPAKSCAELLETNPEYTNFSKICTCNVTIELSQGFGGDQTYFYYALEEFYQNHRAYVKSRWDAQLRSVTAKGTEDCDPLNKIDGKQVAPCGLVANSLFNDTFKMHRCDDSSCTSKTPVGLDGCGISWKSDRNAKFRNPSSSGDLCDSDAFTDSVKPPNWPVPACRLGQSQAEVPGTPYFAQSTEFGSCGRGYENEDLIVWMRTAALPNFRKLHRKVKTDLPNGLYQVDIDYNFPVKNFEGKKKFLLTTVAWNGGKNPFLGITYLVVGSLCLVAVAVFTVLVMVKKRTLGESAYQWQ